MTPKWSPKSPNWPPKMKPAWLYHQDFAKFSLNHHYNDSNLHVPASLLDLVGNNLPFRPQRTQEERLEKNAMSPSQSPPRSKT
ncbi:hypothetical protein TNCV_3514101 [Trichonephila clavipes]|nr:hypothetical protein TNCV_3514101 [Trichonephila clavipes]